MDKNQQPAADETTEIDDKALDQVVGGGLASIPVGTGVKRLGIVEETGLERYSTDKDILE